MPFFAILRCIKGLYSLVCSVTLLCSLQQNENIGAGEEEEKRKEKRKSDRGGGGTKSGGGSAVWTNTHSPLLLNALYMPFPAGNSLRSGQHSGYFQNGICFCAWHQF